MRPIRYAVVAVVGIAASAGCSRPPLPVNAGLPKDRAELETRYAMIQIGTPEAEIAAFMGRAGAEIAGYSSQVLLSRPSGLDPMTSGEFDRNWPSTDWQGAVRVVFARDGRAKQIQLLRLHAMGPVPAPGS